MKDTILLKTDKGMKIKYAILLVLSLGIFVAGGLIGKFSDVIICVPMIVMLLWTLVYDSEFIHIPPILFSIAMVTMVMFLVTQYLIDEHNLMVEAATYILIGISLGSIGIVISYMSLGRMPGFAQEKPLPIIIESFSIGIAIYAIWIVEGYLLLDLFDIESSGSSLKDVATRFSFVIFGSVGISLYFFSGHGPLRRGIEGFLVTNSEKMGIATDENEEILALIKEGESFNLEFKSTIRLNLKTGEKDKRMEKAVLKSLVAFLNGDGGTLLVGVADDGEILGVDIEGFDNRDKMNLHIINLMSSQIGDEFLPFIRFREVLFGQKENGADRIVVRFDCRPTSTPVFLKDGKDEIYFVRSGPSSVEISGSDLIRYVDNRRKSVKRRYPIARATSQTFHKPEKPESPDE